MKAVSITVNPKSPIDSSNQQAFADDIQWRGLPLLDLLNQLIIVIGETPSITAAVVDSLPEELSFLLVGPKRVAFLRHMKRCLGHFDNDLLSTERNRSDFIRAIQQVETGNANSLLVPVDDSANRLLHSVGKLNIPRFPIPDSRTFEMLNDKWEFYQRCSELGIAMPRTIFLGDKTEIDFGQVCSKVGLPFVLKPTNRADGLGVLVIRSKEDLQSKVLSRQDYNFSPLVAQSFVPGQDIDMSALVDQGRIRHFAIQMRTKQALCFMENADFVTLTKTLVGELSYTGVVHIDARLDSRSGQIFLIEANPRFWGSLAEATAGGLNFVRAGIYTSAGLESPDPTTISSVRVPSLKKMLAGILTFKGSYSKMTRIDRLRLRHGIRLRAQRAFSQLIRRPAMSSQ